MSSKTPAAGKDVARRINSVVYLHHPFSAYVLYFVVGIFFLRVTAYQKSGRGVGVGAPTICIPYLLSIIFFISICHIVSLTLHIVPYMHACERVCFPLSDFFFRLYKIIRKRPIWGPGKIGVFLTVLCLYSQFSRKI